MVDVELHAVAFGFGVPSPLLGVFERILQILLEPGSVLRTLEPNLEAVLQVRDHERIWR